MAEEIVLTALVDIWKQRHSYNIRKGITPRHLIQCDVAYSRPHLYRLLQKLAEQGKAVKLPGYAGYAPIL